jgi:hypothetical protein
VKFLFDVSISHRVADAIAIFEERHHQIETVTSYFSKAAVPDEEFLARLRAEGGWIVLTRDRGKKDGNWHMWRNSGVTVFFLTRGWAKMSGLRMASRLLDYWERIAGAAEGAAEGDCFSVATGGRIDRLR